MKEAIPEQQSLHLIIEGQVQGVYYRHYCREKALELGLTGTVANRSDGTVEIVATGNSQALISLRQWCHSGSPRSRVTAVHAHPIALRRFEGFTILREAV